MAKVGRPLGNKTRNSTSAKPFADALWMELAAAGDNHKKLRDQYRILREIFETMGEKRPVTTRTLDVGGDKELPYIQLSEEPNPFLGVRALRLSLSRPGLFLTQLRAILRAADGYPCRIMFPMVADIEEVRKARQYVEKAHSELKEENTPHAWPVELGIMVEIPSAALLAPVLANEVDFFSMAPMT